MAQSRRPTADEVLQDLMTGNQRFVAGKMVNPRQSPAEFSSLASGQTPDAVIVGCADSRVPPEILFDQGVGDLFVIRVAGNVAASRFYERLGADMIGLEPATWAPGVWHELYRWPDLVALADRNA